MADVVFIGSRCIIKNRNRFFLLAEIEAKVPGVEIDPIILIRITPDQAVRLLKGGLKLCRILDKKPQPRPGLEVEFKCVFIDQGRAFAIFDIENRTDEAVLIRISMEKAQALLRRGARRCTLIARPFT